MKNVALTVLLVLCIAGLAFAQRPRPTATLHEQGLQASTQTYLNPNVAEPVGCPNGDCLFYGGDSDPNNANADGLWDNNGSAFNINGAVYSPFVWSKAAKCGGKCAWVVDNMFANIEYSPFPPAVDGVDWAILSGVVAGGTPSTATTICSGSDSSPVLTDTGRNFFGFYEEFATTVHVAGCSVKVKKGPATLYQVVQPQTSTFQLAYESNIPDSPPPNAIGNAEPTGESYFLAPAFGFATFTNTTQLGPFNSFSAGICGALGK